MKRILTHLLGYPRIGEQRELKKAVEACWQGRLDLTGLEAVGKTLRQRHWLKQKQAGIDLVPCNDFSFYDHVLDLTCLLGNIPARFHWKGGPVDLKTMFLVARGTTAHSLEPACTSCSAPAYASEMTKWFDTNYHYIVPEFNAGTTFALSGTKVFDELAEAQSLGLNAKPVLVGPVTYLSLGKVQDETDPQFDRFSLLDRLLPVYEQIIARLAAQGAGWIQLDEPVLATDLSERQKAALAKTYERLNQVRDGARLLVATYFGELRENLPLLLKLPVQAVHVDAVRGINEVQHLTGIFPSDKILSLGVVDGRNIWKTDFNASLEILRGTSPAIAPQRLWLAPSCSLIHCPVTLRNEITLDAELKNWLAFADEKMGEVAALRDLLAGEADRFLLADNQVALRSRRQSRRIHNETVRTRLAMTEPRDFTRTSPFSIRQGLQRTKLRLPAFPTTTIGSFPQTAEVRDARARWKKGGMSAGEYEDYLKHEIRRCVAFQEEIGIDMPVHGEFERNDMVEYFGEQLEGFAFTANGWVQSYGTRCVKPPVIFGDVSRTGPMTVRWSQYAQTLTSRPMKGMLTGPVTILQWSFVRNDQPRSATAYQIALAIRDEVLDLEMAGIAAIQIDEPAIREGLPLRRTDWAPYLDWAVNAFRLCAAGVRDETQIHTHMCYAEFNDIIQAIAGLDADVITIETSRSNMELLRAFVDFKYPNEIGPGVYDIHSPRQPGVEEMVALLRKAQTVIPPGHLWVNPDCGLKTRSWAEVKPALRNLVECARVLRQS